LADGRVLLLNARGSPISKFDFDARSRVSASSFIKATFGIFLRASCRSSARSYINRAVGGIQQRRQRASRRVTSFSSRYNTMTGTLWHSSCSRAFMMLLHVAGRHYTCIYMHAFSRRYDVILIILPSEFIELLMNFKLQAAILNNAVRHSNLFLA